MILRFTMIISLLLLGIVQLSAQYQTIAGGDGTFNDASNWDASGVPPDPMPAGSSVTISHAIDLNIDFDVNGSFRIVSGGSLTGNKTLKVNGTGTNNGTMSIKKFQVGPNDGSGTFTNNGKITLSGELHIDGTLVNTNEITAAKVKVHGGTLSGGGFIYTSGTIEFDDNEGGRAGSIADMKFCDSDGGMNVPSFTYKDGTGHNVNSANTYVCDGAGAPNNYRLITAGDLAAGIALPVELLSFKGKLDQGKVVLDWITSTELSNDYFSIEYSADGKSFDPIGKVKGAGDSQVEQRYSFVHPKPK